MKKVLLLFFVPLVFSCSDKNSQLVTTKEELFYSNAKLATLDRPMLAIQWSDALRQLSRERLSLLGEEVDKKLISAGLKDSEATALPWLTTKQKSENLHINEKSSVYTNELFQYTGQYMLLHTNLLEDKTLDAKKEVEKNLEFMAKYGSSSIAVVKYVYDKFGSFLSSPLKKQVALEVLKNYRKNVGNRKLSKEEKSEMGKYSPGLLAKMEYMENANLKAEEEFSKY